MDPFHRIYDEVSKNHESSVQNTRKGEVEAMFSERADRVTYLSKKYAPKNDLQTKYVIASQKTHITYTCDRVGTCRTFITPTWTSFAEALWGLIEFNLTFDPEGTVLPSQEGNWGESVIIKHENGITTTLLSYDIETFQKMMTMPVYIHETNAGLMPSVSVGDQIRKSTLPLGDPIDEREVVAYVKHPQIVMPYEEGISWIKSLQFNITWQVMSWVVWVGGWLIKKLLAIIAGKMKLGAENQAESWTSKIVGWMDDHLEECVCTYSLIDRTEPELVVQTADQAIISSMTYGTGDWAINTSYGLVVLDVLNRLAYDATYSFDADYNITGFFGNWGKGMDVISTKDHWTDPYPLGEIKWFGVLGMIVAQRDFVTTHIGSRPLEHSRIKSQIFACGNEIEYVIDRPDGLGPELNKDLYAVAGFIPEYSQVIGTCKHPAAAWTWTPE